MRRILLLVTAVITVLALSGIKAEAKSEKASVMSFNIRIQFPADTGKYNWESRKAGCVKAIRKYLPDIIGLPEAPGTVNHDSDFGFNPVFFLADRFELLDYGSFWLNEDQTPEKKGWDAEYVRSANWVKLRFRKSGQIIFFFNTHLDNTGEKARHESAALMVEKIKEIAGDNAVVFMTGDLNTTSEDKALKPLATYLKESGKTVKKADKTPSFNDFGRNGARLQMIDHIFYRNAEARSFNVVDEPKFGVKYISDHYPVISEFVIEIPKH